MVITWDENKNAANKEKHGVSFELASLIFDDPLFSAEQDRFEDGEERWRTIGAVGGVVLIVAHTWSDDNDVERIRLISARKANSTERNLYEELA